MLRQTNEPKPSLRDKLITRLEQSLEGVHTPSPSGFAEQIPMSGITSNLDYSWHIFDQASLEQLTFPHWSDPSQLQPLQPPPPQVAVAAPPTQAHE